MVLNISILSRYEFPSSHLDFNASSHFEVSETHHLVWSSGVFGATEKNNIDPE